MKQTFSALLSVMNAKPHQADDDALYKLKDFIDFASE